MTAKNIPDFSIVVVNMNTSNWLKVCLPSLLDSQGETSIEVIIVDNGSDDDSESVARSICPDLIWLPQGGNIGYVPANNIGMQASTGRYLMYLNNDTKMHPNCLQHLREFLDENGLSGAVSPRILNGDGTDQGVARSFPTIMNGLFGRRSVLTRLFPNNPWSKRYMSGRNHGSEDPLECEVLSSACLVVRNDLAKRLGGFDEAFTLYWVDSELLGRIRREGYKCFLVPKAKIEHYEGSGGSSSSFLRRCKMTIAFNRDSYLCYVKVLQLHPLHPKRLFAAGVLTLRTVGLMAMQLLQPTRATSSGGNN